MKDKIVPGLVIGALILGVFLMFSGGGNKKAKTNVDVKIPTLSEVATAGQDVFTANCARCHGVNAGGTRSGPPLIHKYYEPNHHGDGAFHNAATMGVRAHHWRFGNMPPIRTVTTQDVDKIIKYIREVQKANGIF